MSPSPSPFVGPRPLVRGEPLLGRELELRALLDLLRSRRIVVVHGESGVGKTSLIHAGLAPLLRRSGFDMWKPVRIHGEAARFADIPDAPNPFVLSAMVSLEDELPSRHRRSPAALARLSFREYIEGRPRRKKRTDQHVVLVFDQLEDLFQASGRGEACRGFFEAIGAGLDNETYWALLVVRDELLAKLTLYHHWIPTRMSNTFHLGSLTPAAATQVIGELAGQAGRRVEDLDQLVEQLSTADAHASHPSLDRVGAVDPLHLQVVCRQLWTAAPGPGGCIEGRSLEPSDDPQAALRAYCGAVTRQVSGHDTERERQLRASLARLFVGDRGRAQVPEDALPPANLEPRQIEQLRRYDLLQVEAWGPDRRLELSHARLARALVEDNEAWARANPPVVARLANLVPSWPTRVATGSPPATEPQPGLARGLHPGGDDWAGTTGEWDASAFQATLARAKTEGQASEPAPDAPSSATPADPAARDIARTLLRLSHGREQGPLLELALLGLAGADPRWALAEVEGSTDAEARLLDHLERKLVEGTREGAYAGVDPSERPDLAGLLSALIELGQALASARGPRKRAILIAAFRASFTPGYYVLGISPHLWAIACRIEHPELVQLDVMAREHAVGEPIGLRRHELNAFFVTKLVELGLVVREEQARQVVTLAELGTTFLDFLRHGGLRSLHERGA